MSYYQLNEKEILPKAKERYSKKSYWVLYTKQRSNKRKSKNQYKNLSKEEKTRLKSIKEKDISNWFSTKKSITK